MKTTKKSRPISAALTFFLGPFGIMYSNVGAGFVWLILGFVITGLAMLSEEPNSATIFMFLLWAGYIFVGDHYTKKHNQEVDNFMKLIDKNNGNNEKAA